MCTTLNRIRKFAISLLTFFLFFCQQLYAQSTQTVSNGDNTTAITFTGASCTYNWVNSNPSVGLPASGTGNIPSFKAINTGSSPVTATITATPATQGYAYIANEGAGTISVINVATNTIATTITPPHDPFCVCISPDGTKAYIGCGGGTSTVTVINTTTNAIIKTIPVSSTGESTGITISPDGSMVYVENFVDNTVSAVNVVTNAVVAVVPVGQGPLGITITPDGSEVYVAFNYTDYISVISTATNTVTGNITLGAESPDVAMSPDGSKLYVPVSNSQSVAVIDPVTNNITATIPLGTYPDVIAISPDGTRAYVTTNLGNVLVINTSTNTIVATVTIDSYANGICVSPDGHFVYVTDSGSNSVSVINTSTNKVIATVKVGTNPVSLGNFVTAGQGCPVYPITFKITVVPSPVMPTITAGTASGTISACQGTASASPDIQQFTVSGSNLTADVVATAQAGFEVSLSAASGYGSSLIIPSSNGSVSSTIVYVRSAADDAAGNVLGNVVLSSTGAANQQVTVLSSVKALPVANPVANQTVANGAATADINFTGTADTYNWTNDAPGIGLAASGVGTIPSFTAVNNSDQPIVANITVTPENAGSGCDGTPVSFTISVNPSSPTTLLSIPNTFTPNGDGINDTWDIKRMEDYPKSTISVFNRWGQKLYTSIGYPVPWDGKYDGEALPSGAYYYMIDLRNGQPVISGWVAIIR